MARENITIARGKTWSKTIFHRLPRFLADTFANLLSANASSAETDASDWLPDANVAAPVRSLAQAAHGVASLQLTALAAGDLSIKTTRRTAVVPGATYTALASLRPNAAVRDFTVGIRWFTAEGDTAGALSVGEEVLEVGGVFTQAIVTAVAPAAAELAEVVVFVIDPLLGEVHFADRMALIEGASQVWALGGPTPGAPGVGVYDTVLGHVVKVMTAEGIDAAIAEAERRSKDRDDGRPVDLTGFAARLKARPSYIDDPLVTMATAGLGITIDGPAGEVTMALTDAETAELEPFVGVYDLEIESAGPDGETTELRYGSFHVADESTR